MDIGSLTLATFTPHVGSVFRIEAGGQAVDLTLAEASLLRPPRGMPPGARIRAEPFQLQLLEKERWSLPQDTYALQHPVIGTLEIFIVPIGPNADRTGFLYQAMFT